MAHENRITDEQSRAILKQITPLVVSAAKSGTVRIDPAQMIALARKIKPNVSGEVVSKLIRGIISARFPNSQIKIKSMQRGVVLPKKPRVSRYDINHHPGGSSFTKPFGRSIPRRTHGKL